MKKILIKNGTGVIFHEIHLKKDYEKELKKLKFNNFEEELIAKTWHPSRFQEWCFDEDQKKDQEE